MSQLLHSPLHKKIPKLCMIPLVVRTVFNFYFIVPKMESKESKYLRSLLNKFLITPIIKNSAYKDFFSTPKQ